MDKQQPFDWSSYQPHLPTVYYNAYGLKLHVYRQWMDNLQRHVSDPNKAKSKEALRRIDFIENHLMNRSAA